MTGDTPTRSPIRGAAVCLALVLAAVLPFSARAAELDSDPPGTQLRIEGPISVYGQAPVPLDPLPPGSYRLSLEGPGLARSKGKLDVGPSGSLATRPWAGGETVFLPPGITHLARREGWRGLILLGGGALGGVEILFQEGRRRDARDEARIQGNIYRNAFSEDAIAAAELRYQNAAQEEQDREEVRNLWAGYLAATWVGAALEAWVLTPRPRLSAAGADGHAVVTGPRAGGFSAGIRSLLVPGSGQRFLGHESRGNFFAVTVLGLAAGTIFTHASYLEAARDQDLAQGRYDLARSEPELDSRRRALESASGDRDDWDTARKALAGLTAGMYLWNVLDAVLTADSVPSAPPATSFSVEPRGDGFAAALSRRIP